MGIALLAAVGVGQAVATLTIAVALCGIVTGRGGGAIALLAGAFAARAGLAWTEQVAARRTAAKVTDELRRSLLRAVVGRGPAWVASYGGGRLTAVLGTGLDALRPWFSGYLPALVLGVVLPPLVVVVMAVVDPASAVIAAFTLPLIPLLGALIGWATQARARQRWAADARLAGHFLDVVHGLPTLKVFGRAERQTDVIADLTDRHRSATLRVLRVAFLSSTALDLVGTLSVGLIAVQAGLRVAAGTMELAPALLVILLAPEAYRPLREMAARYHASTDAGAVIADVDEILTAPTGPADGSLAPPTGPATRVADAPRSRHTAGDKPTGDCSASLPDNPDERPGTASPAPTSDGTNAAARLTFTSIAAGRWGVRVAGLRARYPGGRGPAVTLDELDVRGGEIVALRGVSGAGKTTALRVLAGLHPAEAGAVAVGRTFFLPQRPALPHARTVAEVFPPGTSADEIRAALHMVGLGGEVSETTPLGEHGSGVSSGQRQRLALAALLHRAEADVRAASGQADVRAAPGQADVRATSGQTDVRAAPGQTDVRAAPGQTDVRAAPGRADVRAASGQVDVRAASGRSAVRTLLLDEPTAHLDAVAERRIVKRLREFAGRGFAVLVVAHRPGLLAAADRVVELPSPTSAAGGPGEATQPVQGQVVELPSPTSAAGGPGEATQPVRGRVVELHPPAGSAGGSGEAARTDSRPRSVPGGPESGDVNAGAATGWGDWGVRLRRPAVAVGLGAGASVAGIVLTGAAAWLLVRASFLPPVLSLSAAVVLVRGSAVARPLLRYLERLVAHDLAFARLGRRRANVYAALVPRVPGRLTHRRGDLLTRLVNDVDAQVDGLLRGRLPALAALVTVVVAGVAVVVAAPMVAVPLAVGLLVAGVVAPAVAAWQVARVEAATGVARAALRDAVVETVDAVEEIGAGAGRVGVPEERSRTLALLEARQAREAGLAGAIAHLGWGAAAAGTALALAGGGLSAEWSAVMLLGMIVLGETVVGLPEAAIARRQAAGAAQRVAALTEEPASWERPSAERQPRDARSEETRAEETRSEEGRSEEGRSEGTGSVVRVRGLVAGWDLRRGPVIDGLDLELAARSRTAITGRSGSGKSTLAAVLGGLLAPASGHVEISGSRPALLVGEETAHVFASSVRENLRLAAPAATDRQLALALGRVGLGAWLAELPDGLDTWLGTGGSTVSGGQRRRLATARALLAEPGLLILDEPTEGIDEAGARELMADLLDAASGRTVLVLAHRSEGLDLVDRVLTLDDTGVGGGSSLTD
ncbi:thiol reductant ABC exporter subunit CydC [Actinoplanes sp. NPDC051861]|uniref:thiol reductant ABC exporter subunit CydC n=1 Tax=Actinoplanes sp. NPDC051861 TaxID=3155170 RepID=UPI00342E36CF